MNAFVHQVMKGSFLKSVVATVLFIMLYYWCTNSSASYKKWIFEDTKTSMKACFYLRLLNRTNLFRWCHYWYSFRTESNRVHSDWLCSDGMHDFFSFSCGLIQRLSWKCPCPTTLANAKSYKTSNTFTSNSQISIPRMPSRHRPPVNLSLFIEGVAFDIKDQCLL